VSDTISLVGELKHAHIAYFKVLQREWQSFYPELFDNHYVGGGNILISVTLSVCGRCVLLVYILLEQREY
jgi:hypothetical protein